MSDSFGSILQPPPTIKKLSNVNLLIANHDASGSPKIIESLHSANFDFTYEHIAIDELGKNLAQECYGALLYDNSNSNTNSESSCLVKKLRWWCHVYTNIPVILITHPLGDEQAIRLIQTGISAYILAENIDQLPRILAKALSDNRSDIVITARQQNIIQQQQQTIHQLKTEKQSWLKQEELKQEHIAHLSHELRSPIASMVGFANMLKEEYYGKLNLKQMQYVSALLSVGEHMLDLVKNYLDLVKIDAKTQILELERLAIGDICQASIYIVDEKAKQKGLKLIFNLENNIHFCIADSVRLKQILVNLLSNAIKFTDEGSVILDVKLKNNQLYFAVIDTGTGISATNIQKLFKPFPQISSHHENTGLGLALSQKIANLHGGEITVVSELGKGSCFTLCIPQLQ